MKKYSQALVYSALGAGACLPQASAVNTDVDRPNIVFYMTEDLSPHYLALFTEGKGCEMPNLAKLAKEGILYPNAYSNASVSSAARTTLITGCYAPRFAGSLHRSFTGFPMPKGLRMFPTYLKQKGYYTVNSVKTDYNVALDEGAWDIIRGEVTDWKKRPDSNQPFLLVRTNMVTHESRVQFKEAKYQSVATTTDPNSVYLHDYLPDTKLVRYTYATLYDRIKESDKDFGDLVDMIRDAGELDNTFIFFMGDNGGCLPGTKGYTDNIGLQVPLMIYIPKTWRDKVDQSIGSVQEGLVSFMDLAPTVLNLAGVPVPEQMDGKPLLGKNSIKGHECVYGYGDRYDEFYAFNRSMRKGDFRYARNFQPYHPQSLHAHFRYIQLAFQEWRNMYKAGKLNELQSSFFQPFGPEELYDLKNDPMEKKNLAADPKYAQTLKDMRQGLCDYLLEKSDMGFFPENILLDEAMPDLEAYGQANKSRIAQFIQIANLQMSSPEEALAPLKKAMASADPVENWWALTTAAYFAKKSSPLKADIEKFLTHPRSYVRMRALVALSRIGLTYTDKEVKAILKDCKNQVEALVVLNDVTYLFENGYMKPFELTKVELPYSHFSINWRKDYLNLCAGVVPEPKQKAADADKSKTKKQKKTKK